MLSASGLIMPDNSAVHIAIVLFTGLISGWICKKLNISILIGYLVVGTIIGPGCLDLTATRAHKIRQENRKAQSYLDSEYNTENLPEENMTGVPGEIDPAKGVSVSGETASEIAETPNSEKSLTFSEADIDKDLEEQLRREREEDDVLEKYAEFGVLLLLFAIGIEFSLDKLMAMAYYMFVGGLLQMVLTCSVITLFFYLLGLSWTAGIVSGCVIALSSTALVYKSMEEAYRANTRDGRATLGVLLFQDVALVPVLLLLPLLFKSENIEEPVFAVCDNQWIDMVVKTLIFGGAVIFGRLIIARFFIPQLAKFRTNELVILFAIVVLIGMCLLATCLGLPDAIGALAAGFMLGENRLTSQIDALVLPFREAYSAIFFISLGMLMDFAFVIDHPIHCFVAFICIIALKWMTSWVSLMACGMKSRTALGFGLCISQVGELAFMILALAFSANAIEGNAYHTILFVSVTSLVITPNMVLFALNKICPLKGGDEKEELSDKASQVLEEKLARGEGHSIVVGVGHIGARLAERLASQGKTVAMIDFSPVNLHKFAQMGFTTVVGSGSDSVVLQEAGITQAKIVVITVPDDNLALAVVRACNQLNPGATIICRARYRLNIRLIHNAGAKMVVCEENDVCEKMLRLVSIPDAV